MSPLPETAWGIPSIGINGLSGFGDSTEGPYTNKNKVFEFIDNVSWIKGRHSFKVGAHFRFDHYNQVGNQFPRGGFQFDGRATGSLNGTATPIAPSFADFLLGYQRLSELSVQLAVTEFRAVSQSYYFTDTWRMRDNMTLDLGLRYEYVPPFEDKAGTLINASMPFFDQGLPVADMSRHPTLVRIGEGEFYEDFNIRYNPSMQTARDGRLGNRLVDDDKLNLAPRVGWAWTPTPATRPFAPASACSTCRTRATRASTWPATPRDVVRTPPTSSSIRPGTPPSWDRARMPAACSRRSSASPTTTCSATTSTEAPPGCCSTSSTCSARSGATRRSKSATSARAAPSSSACSIATR